MKSGKKLKGIVYVDCEWICLAISKKDEYVGQKLCFCRKQRIGYGRILQKRIEKGRPVCYQLEKANRKTIRISIVNEVMPILVTSNWHLLSFIFGSICRHFFDIHQRIDFMFGQSLMGKKNVACSVSITLFSSNHGSRWLLLSTPAPATAKMVAFLQQCVNPLWMIRLYLHNSMVLVLLTKMNLTTNKMISPIFLSVIFHDVFLCHIIHIVYNNDH